MIETESRDGVFVVRLNRAAERNALIPPLLAALVESLRSAGAQQRPIRPGLGGYRSMFEGRGAKKVVWDEGENGLIFQRDRGGLGQDPMKRA